MKIATYHNHDVGSFLHAGALAIPSTSLTALRRSRRRYAINIWGSLQVTPVTPSPYASCPRFIPSGFVSSQRFDNSHVRRKLSAEFTPFARLRTLLSTGNAGGAAA